MKLKKLPPPQQPQNKPWWTSNILQGEEQVRDWSVEFPPPSPEKEEEEYLAEELICSFCNEVFRKRSRASTFVNHIAKQYLELFLEGIRFKKPTTF